MCDFNDVDPEKTLQDYEKLLKMTNSTSETIQMAVNNENKRPNLLKFNLGQNHALKNNNPSSISIMLDHKNNRINPQQSSILKNDRWTGGSRPYMQRWLAENEDHNRRKTIDDIMSPDK